MPEEPSLFETGDVRKKKVPNGVVYGESHVYHHSIDITAHPMWREIKQAARTSDVVILEHTGDLNKNIWANAARGGFTYNRAAWINATWKKKDIHFLDSTLNMDSSQKAEAFQRELPQINFREETILLIDAFRLSIYIDRSDDRWKEAIRIFLRDSIGKTDTQTEERIIERVDHLWTEKRELLLPLLNLDAYLRERLMQRNLATVLSEIGDQSFMILVGELHHPGVVKTCEDHTYLTEIPMDEYSEVIDFLRQI